MHGTVVVLVVSVFLASSVEMVEALTIVLAVGVTCGWRPALQGAALALGVLAAVVATAGPALVHYVPLDTLRVAVGSLLLVFGLQWLRKAVLRAVGLRARHDEDAIFDRQVAALRAEGTPGPAQRARRHRGGAVVAFKGVALEGLEVVVIVLTLGTAAHRLAAASLAAGAAVVLVAVVGVVVARQLAGVPENALKMVVGVMLVSFGSFWAGEGVGVRWPGGEVAVVVLAVLYGAAAWAAVLTLRARRHGGPAPAGPPAEAVVAGSDRQAPWAVFARLVAEFLVGDTPELLAGTLAVVGAGALLAHQLTARAVPVVAVPVMVVLVLGASTARGSRLAGPPGPDAPGVAPGAPTAAAGPASPRRRDR